MVRRPPRATLFPGPPLFRSEARTPYFYSGHERTAELSGEADRGERESAVILGAGPNRIGQGIEFDYCCVHAAMTGREDRKSTRLNSSHANISYAVFCLKKKR